jgi:hypothetical protein
MRQLSCTLGIHDYKETHRANAILPSVRMAQVVIEKCQRCGEERAFADDGFMQEWMDPRFVKYLIENK